MKQPKKTGKHVFWRLKITKKTQYNTKNPGWFHVKQEKTAKITTINSEFFCNNKQSGEPRSVFLACVPRETLFFSKILNIYAFCSTWNVVFFKKSTIFAVGVPFGVCFFEKIGNFCC